MVSTMAAEFGPGQGAAPSALTPVLRALAVVVIVAITTVTYVVLARQGSAAQPYNPLFIALLLVGNLIAGSALLVLVGRSLARRRAARSPLGGNGQLHVRLVALFSIAAAVPLALVTITASLLFQYGSQFWSSDTAQAMLGNTRDLVQLNYQREVSITTAELKAMTGDLSDTLRSVPIEADLFRGYLGEQAYRRELSEAMILRAGDKDPLAIVNPYKRPLINVVTAQMMRSLDRGAPSVLIEERDRIGVLVKLDYGRRTYLYGSRLFDQDLATQMRRSDAITADYRALQSRSRSLQLRFNAALLGMSLLIVGLAVWIALQVADRLARPVSDLVGAARRVAEGDLAARVPETKERDEVGTLSRAFNTMTGRIQQQNAALESRRALIEAVMAGVSAGVVATDAERKVTIANNSAARLLGADAIVGRALSQVCPELDLLVRDGQREAIVQVGGHDEPRTLAVRIARAEASTILTFDDITQQQLDQRRAAWADVARRIAHEIKNPLTPIQLAAERLQRRYGGKIDPADGTFRQLTDTIVRQVGDLRRMVDEFSSFARMPKPVFREESLADIARQTLFLHEVAYPTITFALVSDDPGPQLVCDRRQIGQALTNLVKNAVEAIEGAGAVTLTLTEARGKVCIEVSDTGTGLPEDRERILEPYVTNRVKGTGLGLAIVKKIIEEHAGTMTLSDRHGGGSTITLTFDAAALLALEHVVPTEASGEEQLAQLMPMRT
ncbi:MAG: ATPase [Sphingomonas bacterium]|uniref:sensor histidine kinase NtrY-like n=1 Tax=Sphingomonas bacterium TaxID=1895847 RepID=UPI00261A517A|nr:ATP-binding protein [Sphingomonas bacterium]MDB5696395.1 ATPase [Sphingomonas bacterium]